MRTIGTLVEHKKLKIECYIYKMSFCIYLHKNKINNKCYVGQTNQIPKYRWGSDGRNYKSGYFHSAIVCYG